MFDVRTRWCLRGRASVLPGLRHQATRGYFVVPGKLQAPGFSRGVDDATVPHEPRETVDLAVALKPRTREGVAELVRRHPHIGDASRHLSPLHALLHPPGGQRP